MLISLETQLQFQGSSRSRQVRFKTFEDVNIWMQNETFFFFMIKMKTTTEHFFKYFERRQLGRTQLKIHYWLENLAGQYQKITIFRV